MNKSKAPKDQDEAKLETLAKRLLATPPKPHIAAKKPAAKRKPQNKKPGK
jgi:hypothetical protein